MIDKTLKTFVPLAMYRKGGQRIFDPEQMRSVSSRSHHHVNPIRPVVHHEELHYRPSF